MFDELAEQVHAIATEKGFWHEEVYELTELCPTLRSLVGDKVAITELLIAVFDKYALYYDCSLLY